VSRTPPPQPVSVPRLSRFASALIIAGPLVSISGGRWGSYIGIAEANLFLSDFLVAAGTLLVLAHVLTSRADLRLLLSPIQGLGLLVIVVGLSHHGTSPSLIVRDIAPFAYLLVSPLFRVAVNNIGRVTVEKALGTALLLHLVWFVPAVFNILPSIQSPISSVALFDVRGDYDGMVTGVAVLWLLLRTRIPLILRVTIGVAATAAIVAQGSRAAIIGTVVAIFIYTVLSRPFRHPRYGPLLVASICFFFTPCLAVLLLAVKAPPDWAAGLIKLFPSNSAGYLSGQNTQNARASAWQLVLDYMHQSTTLEWWGAGAGQDVIAQSGALQHLSGDPSVRQAHNFLVTWYAMFGLIAVAITAACIAVALIALFLPRNRQVVSPIGASLLVATVSIGLIGVVLESPFGYQTVILCLALNFTARAGDPNASGRQKPDHLRLYSTTARPNTA